MSEIKLEYLSALEIGELVNSRVVTPTEVLKYFEKRIKERNKSINAFTYTRFDLAYIEAKKIRRKIRTRGKLRYFCGCSLWFKGLLAKQKGLDAFLWWS
ncbi:MAG: hypothetical protein SPJ17_01215 [Anaeroplasma sp.]|uniref:hypothetical protein n=1 Tax=Anaeroplasma sp. TaxID=1872523 RepID=UPI002A91C181|nr:hypothetical protein [Anaeroplasma sp.]MDY5982307.1 hypothetical protein [Anaeroplasma sp.]